MNEHKNLKNKTKKAFSTTLHTAGQAIITTTLILLAVHALADLAL